MSVPKLADLEVGHTLPPLSVRFTRATLVRYAGASTDPNPIHYSDYFAAKAGLPGVIAHGLLTMGTALRVVTDWTGDPTRVRSYFVRFTKPVVVPDTEDGVEVVFTASVTAVADSVVTLAIEAVYADLYPSGGDNPPEPTRNDIKVLGAARAEVDLGDRG